MEARDLTPSRDETTNKNLPAEASPFLGLDPSACIRAVRRTRRISQRELADLAGLPLSTISRAEAGISVPRLDTFLDLIGAAGFGIAQLDRQGRPLRLDAEHDRLRDAALRRFPAHLAWFGEPDGEWGPYWWGWHHIAFWPSRENVPAHIFRHRRTLPRFWGGDAEQTREYGRVWDDAT